jgi:amino acid transporter
MTDTTAQAAVEDQKATAGRTATVLWIATGLYYFAFTPEASFASWQSIAFFLIGMFVAAFVFGAASYYLFRAHRQFYERHVRGNTALSMVAAVLNLASNFFEIVAPIVVARWVFLGMHGLG